MARARGESGAAAPCPRAGNSKKASVDAHEIVKRADGEQVLYCNGWVITGVKATLFGLWCHSCRRMVDGPYAGQTFDVAPWEVGVLVNDA